MRRFLYASLVLLFLAHNDWWLWQDSHLLMGLPVGLTYHLLYCFAVMGMMALLVRFAWPLRLRSERSEPEETSQVKGATEDRGAA